MGLVKVANIYIDTYFATNFNVVVFMTVCVYIDIHTTALFIDLTQRGCDNLRPCFSIHVLYVITQRTAALYNYHNLNIL